ncbi:BadF-type ATPase [Paramicrobacterium humi]|uniref:BadF-type ATPase n=1 Tax=Paramicrobacterium humi TaxID=640635 RepID=A0A1H4J5U9_9MICO|nr:BadF/BadG/BcrA/BcrD ATPase family protein [Microbacterium humi]SEB41591.1 BadF-type ATPase [Microbacterium humi]
MYLLGLDAGGTSTRATLVTADGTCVGYGRAGGGNPISSGPEHAASEVLSAISAALQPAGAALSDVRVIVSAMAGSSTHGPQDWLRDPLVEGGFSGRLVFHSDLLATYFSGTFSPDGYAMVSGTGAAVIRVRDGAIEATADGLGWLLGDRGSGYWIGHQVVLAVAAALDSRGPATQLTRLLLDALGIAATGPLEQGRPAALGALISAVYALRPVQLARFAPLAFQAAGDPEAARILSDAADHLAHTVRAVATPAITGPLVMGGSVLAQAGNPVARLKEQLAATGFAPAITHVSDGAVGSAMLAVRESGVDAGEDIFRAITQSMAMQR